MSYIKHLEHNLVEVLELDKKQNPWYIGVQYHPEYQSSPLEPHPLFVSYIHRYGENDLCYLFGNILRILKIILHFCPNLIFIDCANKFVQ